LLVRKAVVLLSVIALLAIGGVSYAHMRDDGGQGHMRGGGHDACYCAGGPSDGKFLDETVEQRRELHSKRFDYMEALRLRNYEKAETLEKEIEAIQDKLEANSGGTEGKGFGRGYGRHSGMYGSCGR
jgi:hypothetical protein